MWPTSCADHIVLAERYRSSQQWIDAAIEYRKARERAKDADAWIELLAQESEMLRRAWKEQR